MKVQKISPQGYCGGVILSLKKVMDTLNDKTTLKPIYLLGKIIHNEKVCQSLEALGVIILDDKLDRLEMLDEIKSGTVIFSAHGVSKKVYEKALKKGLKIVDATCPFVNKVHEEVLKKLNENYEVIYLGNEKHPEALELLKEDERIKLIYENTDFKTFDQKKKYYLTNQTTLSLNDLEKVYQKAKILPNLEIENNICLSTTKRQEALKGLKTDLFLVVGDKLSSNTNKLYEVAKSEASFKKLLKIETLDDLKGLDLTNYKEALITSGASTPKKIVDEIINYLENYPKLEAKSTLSLKDYLEI